MADGMGNADIYERSNINPYPLYIKQVVLTVVVCLILLVAILLVLHFCAWRRHGTTSPDIPLDVASPVHPQATTTDAPDPSVTASLPSLVYKKGGVDGDGETAQSAECAVCLSNVEEGETVRVLPICKHMFHANRVDAWFGSNSTCPVCRVVVVVAEPQQPTSVVVQMAANEENFADRMHR